MNNRKFSIDEIVIKAIKNTFPDMTVPDENNFISKGKQYKAPDHSCWSGKILIERKSLNPKNDTRIGEKVLKIAEKQGKEFVAFGQFNVRKIVQQLPDPAQANRELTDYGHRRLEERLRETDKKFEDYAKHQIEPQSINILIVSDHSEIEGNTDSTEYYIGRRMGGLQKSDEIAPNVHAVFYIKHPNYVWDRKDSYWFLSLSRESLGSHMNELIDSLANNIHDQIKTFPNFWPENLVFTKGKLRHRLI
ncbi:MAG: hypothetical protein ABJM86_03070, partial [Hyphomicrobiales bacterium]